MRWLGMVPSERKHVPLFIFIYSGSLIVYEKYLSITVFVDNYIQYKEIRHNSHDYKYNLFPLKPENITPTCNIFCNNNLHCKETCNRNFLWNSADIVNRSTEKAQDTIQEKVADWRKSVEASDRFGGLGTYLEDDMWSKF